MSHKVHELELRLASHVEEVHISSYYLYVNEKFMQRERDKYERIKMQSNEDQFPFDDFEDFLLSDIQVWFSEDHESANSENWGALGIERKDYHEEVTHSEVADEDIVGKYCTEIDGDIPRRYSAFEQSLLEAEPRYHHFEMLLDGVNKDRALFIVRKLQRELNKAFGEEDT